MKALFLPDWRQGNNYQEMLGTALAEHGVEVVYPSGYRRGLPMTRACRDARPDLIHMHWPEAYLARNSAEHYRTWRYPWDLLLANRTTPMVYTAHNVLPHNTAASSWVRAAYRQTIQRSRAVFVHSDAAGDEVERTFGFPSLPLVRIWHGDPAAELGAPINRVEARRRLELGESPVCLMFGVVEPYKGIEGIISYWRQCRPNARLAVAGRAISPEYETSIRALADGAPSIDLRLNWLNDEELVCWLSAADVAIFNYVRILTSGSVALARSFGVPIVLPKRLSTIELAEPNSRVIRFESPETDFGLAIEAALEVEPDYDSAADWREATSWSAVAEVTFAAYRQALGIAESTITPTLQTVDAT